MLSEKFKKNIEAFLLVNGIVFIIILAATFTWAINYSDYAYSFGEYSIKRNGKIMHLTTKIVPSDCNDLISTFPYTSYYQADNWKDVNTFHKDYVFLESICSDKFNVMNVMTSALTTQNRYWDLTNIDSLNILYNWANTFNTAIYKDSVNAIVYDAIYGYWMNELALALSTLIKDDENLRYSFKYRFLEEICRQNKLSIGAPLDSSTKIINYVIEGKWYYLIVQRLWKGTHITFKIVLILILITTLISYFLLFKKLLTKPKLS